MVLASTHWYPVPLVQMKKSAVGLGVVCLDEKIILCCRSSEANTLFEVYSSVDGINFESISPKARISEKKKPENIADCSDFSLAKLGKIYFLSYLHRAKGKSSLNCAYSLDLINWQKIGRLNSLSEPGRLLADFLHHGNFVFYYGSRYLDVALSSNLETWHDTTGPMIKLPGNVDGKFHLKISHLSVTPQGILAFYFLTDTRSSHHRTSIRSLVFDKYNPKTVIPATEQLIWRQPENVIKDKLDPIDLTFRQNRLLSYWHSKNGLVVLDHADFQPSQKRSRRFSLPLLGRLPHNPIMSPKPENDWESVAVFNPTAVLLDGKVHLLYRAIGNDNVSVIGYACSKDGLHIDERLNKPVFASTCLKSPDLSIPPATYASGGGIAGTRGGTEDPRLTRIGDHLFLFYTDYNGWDSVRIAFTSISVTDFLNRDWNWSDPVVISPPGVSSKNACILPEKIKGKYVIFHRLHLGSKVRPNILIDFVDDLKFSDKWLEGHHQINTRPGYWDSLKVGLGAPPIKTKYGWLMIYQGVGEDDSSRYKMGAMLLDINDPAKVIHRCEEPIMGPDEAYENYGCKFGVIYPCGAVIKKDQLLVYYGGSDTYSCLAAAPINRFLNQLKWGGRPKLQPLVTNLNLSVSK